MEKTTKYRNIALTNVHHGPGIYTFYDKNNTLLYIGKAIDVYRRVKQYVTAGKTLEGKTAQLVKQIASIQTIKTASEFDALLLEARLIRIHKPKYNIIAKDDKSPLYITITKDTSLPFVQCLRKSDISGSRYYVFGPFQSGRIARTILQTLRRIVPFCTQKRQNGSACFYTHIGLCNPCPSVIAKMEEGSKKDTSVYLYKRNIRLIRMILGGHINSVALQVKREMNMYARKELFEKASYARNQIIQLHELVAKRYDPELYIQGDCMLDHMKNRECMLLQNVLQPYIKAIKPLNRIECVDISTLSGAHSTGSIVVLIDGLIDRSLYRRFKIRNTRYVNDLAMMQEVIMRRLKHNDWPFPDLLIVDGGKSHIHATAEILNRVNMHIPLIGLAKRFEIIYVYTDTHAIQEIRLPLDSPALHIVQRVRDEAHRFAHTYQLFLRHH